MKLSIHIIILFLALYNSACFSNNRININSDTGFNVPYIIPETTTIINGIKTPLMIDLGASMGNADIILKKKAAKKLRIRGHLPKACGYSQSGNTCYLTASISNIQIGNRNYQNLNALIASKDWGGATFYKNIKLGKSYKNGAITLSFLKKFNVLFDFKNRSLILYDKYHFPDKPIYQHPPLSFTITNGVNTTLTINKNKLHIVWDTALTPSILSNTKISSNQTVDCDDTYTIFQTMPKCFLLNSQQLSHSFMVCDTKLPPDAKIDGVIGSDYFYTHNVFIDFTNNLIYTT